MSKIQEIAEGILISMYIENPKMKSKYKYYFEILETEYPKFKEVISKFTDEEKTLLKTYEQALYVFWEYEYLTYKNANCMKRICPNRKNMRFI